MGATRKRSRFVRLLVVSIRETQACILRATHCVGGVGEAARLVFLGEKRPFGPRLKSFREGDFSDWQSVFPNCSGGGEGERDNSDNSDESDEASEATRPLGAGGGDGDRDNTDNSELSDMVGLGDGWRRPRPRKVARELRLMAMVVGLGPMQTTKSGVRGQV